MANTVLTVGVFMAVIALSALLNIIEAPAMSETQKYNLVERHRLDTWAFITFMMICAMVSYL